MRYVVQARIRTLLAQQSGHIQLLIFAPILTLFLLSLVVRTANSAVDPTVEKKKITQQLKQRLIEVRNAEGSPSSLANRPGNGSPTVAKTFKNEESGKATGHESPALVSATQSHSLQSESSTGERWITVETEIDAKLLLQPLPESQKIVASQDTSGKNPAPLSEQNFATIKWQVAKNGFRGFSLPSTKPSKQSKQKDEKGLVGVALRSPEDVKRELANATPKSSAPILTAAITPVPLPIPKLTPPKEESVVSYPEHLSYHVKRNQTLEKILKEVKVPRKEMSQWTTAARKLSEFQRLKPGQVLELSFSQDIDSPGLRMVSLAPEEELQLILERKNAKQISASRIQPPLQPVWIVLGGRVEKGLSKSLKKTGLPEQLVKNVVNLEWDVDLSDLRTGDSFKILVEAVQRGRKIVEYKTVLAAELLNGGQTFTAFSISEEREVLRRKRFEEKYRGQGLEIESEGQKFLRFPLEFSRISSSFSESRVHPILHRARRHNGIDFSAPYGTPVYSVAKGKITFVGRKSGYGNLVTVDHPGPYETAYAHLQSFAAGIEEGSEVEQGRVLGYVGSTGLATGPHLHFELLKEGVFVNPFSERAEDVDVAAREEQPAPVDPVVEAKKQSFLEKLATLDISGKGLSSLVILQQHETSATAASGRQENGPKQASSRQRIQR
ncbi:MAG: hypothetical protein FJ147_03285 [Deltaproteobacteria bacterium]|nr:hypothetical protein [Deltaproteobacteria bacterium]